MKDYPRSILNTRNRRQTTYRFRWARAAVSATTDRRDSSGHRRCRVRRLRRRRRRRPRRRRTTNRRPRGPRASGPAAAVATTPSTWRTTAGGRPPPGCDDGA